jgi:hypothetical protein
MDEQNKPTETADDKRNKKVDDILGYKNLIDQYPDNDFFLFPFMSMVLDLTDERGFITEEGMKILHNDLQADMDIVKEGGEKPSQYALCRLSLWYCLTYNISQLYCSFVSTFGLEEARLYTDKLPEELKVYLKGIAARVEALVGTLEKLCKLYTSALTDKFAKIFNSEKRRCWTKDLFNTSVHIPAHKNDYPEGFKQEASIELK